VQIAGRAFDHRLGFLLGIPDAGHHEDRRLHAEVPDALEQVEALDPGPGVAQRRHHHVEQDQIEPLPDQEVVRLGDGIGRGDLVRVPVLEAGEDLLQQGNQGRLVVDDEDPLRHANRYTSTSTDLPFTRTAGS
jgi:hypothetical protein